MFFVQRFLNVLFVNRRPNRPVAGPVGSMGPGRWWARCSSKPRKFDGGRHPTKMPFGKFHFEIGNVSQITKMSIVTKYVECFFFAKKRSILESFFLPAFFSFWKKCMFCVFFGRILRHTNGMSKPLQITSKWPLKRQNPWWAVRHRIPCNVLLTLILVVSCQNAWVNFWWKKTGGTFFGGSKLLDVFFATILIYQCKFVLLLQFWVLEFESQTHISLLQVL